MPKQRGFRPGGIPNPMVMSRKVIPSGPSLMEKLQRQTRPTWEDLRSIVKKKETSSAEFLMKWEQEHFHEELTNHRESKRTTQEKQHLKELRKEAKRIRKEQEGEDVDSNDGRETKRRKKKKSSDESLEKKKRKKYSSSKEDDDDVKKGAQNNPYRLSTFFKMDG